MYHFLYPHQLTGSPIVRYVYYYISRSIYMRRRGNDKSGRAEAGPYHRTGYMNGDRALHRLQNCLKSVGKTRSGLGQASALLRYYGKEFSFYRYEITTTHSNYWRACP